MSIFRSRKKFTISERDPQYKVRYLGNVQTALMKGDGCVDKATGVLWNNFSKSNGTVGIDMKLQICATGLKAHTKEQGLTEYRAHRISYCIAHPKYPKVFVWVYRHEGKRMKVELRCHAVLCKTEAKAKAMAVQLHEKLTWALQEFMREKTRRQNVRLTLQRTNSMPLNSSGISGIPMRKKFLSQGQNFKPPIERSASAPKLGDISEDIEEEEIQSGMGMITEEEEEVEEDMEELLDDEMMVVKQDPEADSCSTDTDPDSPILNGLAHTNPPSMHHEMHDLANSLFALEVGNNLDELRQDAEVQFHLHHQDSDDNSSQKSSESGFSEKDPIDHHQGSISTTSNPLANSSSCPAFSNGSILNNTNHVSATSGFIDSNGKKGISPLVDRKSSDSQNGSISNVIECTNNNVDDGIVSEHL